MSVRRPRPRASRTLGPVVALALVSSLAACGGGDESDQEDQARGSGEPDAAAQSCREQWRDLADDVEEQAGPAEDATPSRLRSRWVTIAAQVDYYAATAQAADCENTLAAEEAQVEALTDFTQSLGRLDVEKALSGYERALDETSYARPSGREGRAAPTVAQVRSALADLERLAPQATAQQAAGWRQAAAVDLGDAKARKKALTDLRVVSREAAAYQRAQRAIAVLERAQSATG